MQPRTPYQYLPQTPEQPAEVIVVTLFQGGSVDWAALAQSLVQQSLQSWCWRIVCRPHDRAQIEQILDVSADPRIRIVPVIEAFGTACTQLIAAAHCRYCCLLDAQTQLEPTFLEKSLWLLETHAQVACCSAYVTDRQTTWPYGFEQGQRFLQRTYLSGTLVVKQQAYEAAGGLDQATPPGYEGWDLVLRLARSQQWGAMIPEALIVCQDFERVGLSEAAAERVPAPVRHYIADQYAALDGQFPALPRPLLHPYQSFADTLPIQNQLAKPTGIQRILIVMPWLIVGGAERVNMNLIEYLTSHGYEVSIATTLLNVEHNWVAGFAQHTTDIFLLDHFLQLPDFPRFLVYLLQSRQIDTVMISNSYFGYQVLPYLRAHCPMITIVDYCHSGDELWRNGGYPRCGMAYQQLIDLNIASSENVKQWMVQRGADVDRIEVAYTNVDVTAWQTDPIARQRVRSALNLRDQDVLIVFVGRLSGEKRPTMIARILARLREQNIGAFRCLVIGDGPERPALAQLITTLRLDSHISLLGRISDQEIHANLAAADVLLLPSETEGISVAIFEAMAMGVIPVSARVGGQAELVTPECGFLIPREGDEIDGYVAALQQIMGDTNLRQRMRHATRDRVEQYFPLSGFGPRMVQLFGHAALLHQTKPPLAVSIGFGHEHVVQAIELQRIEQALDSIWAEREQLRQQIVPPLTTTGLARQLIKRMFGPMYHWAVAHGMPWLIPLRRRIGMLLRSR
jgi:glycosyltransferase involved in cell wall biosynthesis